MDSLEKRIARLYIFVLLALVVITLRLFWLQVFHYSYFEARALGQHAVKEVISAKRGEIFIREKERIIPVATTKEGWLLAIDPREVEKPEELYAALSGFLKLPLSQEEFTEKASKKNDPYEIIMHRVSQADKQKIADAYMRGVVFSEESWRFYPAGDFASDVLGYVGADAEGKYGIERYFEELLSGKSGLSIREETLGGRLLLFGRRLIEPEEDGRNITLTLDAGIQSYLEKVMRRLEEEYHAESAGGIVLDPKSGKIIAMVGVPSFDPNGYSKEKDIGVFKNPNVESLFEMGSVIKPLTMAAALDAGVVTRDTTYIDQGRLEIDGATIENFDGKGRGQVPIQEILLQSLNTGAVFLMGELGKEKFRSYMQAYGLGEKTNITLPGEVGGNLKNLQSTRDIEYATASFGQGISMTPLEAARALSSLANGGVLINPYIVEDQDKVEQKRILKEETAREITRMLVEVVDTKLANGKGKIPGYAVAAKTGTAQIANSAGRGYSQEFLHTFFGYGPAYDPEFLVFLFLERPRGVRYASETLTEPFRAAMQYLFSYFEVPPDRVGGVTAE
ncbi:MAG: penicillin-binding protein 2 [Candidatus Ryanbacteria bacterium]|nr:penicillin-binding protein 2 [Candidatus Ryanbacteria bacterium]